MNAKTPLGRADDSAQRRRARLTGILLMSVAVASFSGLDTIAKYLSDEVHQLQVAWSRYASAMFLTLMIYNPLTRPGLMRTRRPGLQITRGMLLCLSTAFSFFGLKYIPLAESTAIVFSGPFIIAAISGPVLGEWIGPRRWAAIVVGFLGVLLVTRPGISGIHPAALLTLLGAVSYAFYAITTRLIANADSDETALFYTNLVGAVVLTPPLFLVWSTPQSWTTILLMIAMGAFASFGHYMMIIALRLAPAGVLSPFMYSQLIWVILIGYVVFDYLPGPWTLSGVALIIASGIYLVHRERRRKGE